MYISRFRRQACLPTLSSHGPRAQQIAWESSNQSPHIKVLRAVQRPWLFSVPGLRRTLLHEVPSNPAGQPSRSFCRPARAARCLNCRWFEVWLSCRNHATGVVQITENQNVNWSLLAAGTRAQSKTCKVPNGVDSPTFSSFLPRHSTSFVAAATECAWLRRACGTMRRIQRSSTAPHAAFLVPPATVCTCP